jgi:hypothetical protein
MNPLLRKLEEDVRAAVAARLPSIIANALASRKAGQPFAMKSRFLSEELQGKIHDYFYHTQNLDRINKEWDKTNSYQDTIRDRLRKEYCQEDDARSACGRYINRYAPDIQLSQIATARSAEDFITNHEAQLAKPRSFASATVGGSMASFFDQDPYVLNR